MGRMDVATKNYLKQPERFADLCNYVLFNGRQIIKPEELQEKDISELGTLYTPKGNVMVERLRDILKGCVVKTAKGITYLVIGIENQSDIHYAMPIKVLIQDALNYVAQAEKISHKHRKNRDVSGAEFLSGFSKSDRLVPVITMVIYWNAGKWDGPRSLHEMFEVNDKELLKYVQDYRINLIVPDEIENFDSFKTELGIVMDFLRCSDNKESMKKFVTVNSKYDMLLSHEAIRLLNICVNAGLKLPEKEGVGTEMCRGMEEWIKEEREEGREEGKAVAMIAMIEKYMNKNSVSLEKTLDVLSVSLEEYEAAKALVS